MKNGTSVSGTLTVAEAAKRLGVSAALLYRECGDGKFPCIRIGGRTLISKAKLEDILSGGDYAPASVNGSGGSHVDQG